MSYSYNLYKINPDGTEEVLLTDTQTTKLNVENLFDDSNYKFRIELVKLGEVVDEQIINYDTQVIDPRINNIHTLYQGDTFGWYTVSYTKYLYGYTVIKLLTPSETDPETEGTVVDDALPVAGANSVDGGNFLESRFDVTGLTPDTDYHIWAKNVKTDEKGNFKAESDWKKHEITTESAFDPGRNTTIFTASTNTNVSYLNPKTWDENWMPCAGDPANFTIFEKTEVKPGSFYTFEFDDHWDDTGTNGKSSWKNECSQIIEFIGRIKDGKVADKPDQFQNIKNMGATYSPALTGLDLSSNTTLEGWFKQAGYANGSYPIGEVFLDPRTWDTSNITNISHFGEKAWLVLPDDAMKGWDMSSLSVNPNSFLFNSNKITNLKEDLGTQHWCVSNVSGYWNGGAPWLHPLPTEGGDYVPPWGTSNNCSP